MSWKTVNEILGLASIDKKFCQKLLQNPLDAIRETGFQLTTRECDIMSNIVADNLYDFSLKILTELAPEKE